MKNSRHRLTLALLLALSPLIAGAQTPAARSSGSAASAPEVAKPVAKPDAQAVPKPMSPSAQREAANMPDETRSEGKPVPQLNIPLGKGATGTAKATVNSGVNSKKAPSGGVNDAAARCEAERDAAAREACRDRSAGIAAKR